MQITHIAANVVSDKYTDRQTDKPTTITLGACRARVKLAYLETFLGEIMDSNQPIRLWHSFSLDTPGVPQNIRAVNISILQDYSVILLRWDPPMNVVASFISHYVVNFEAGTSTIPHQLNVIALNCNLNTTIVICAVDICSREGAGTSSVVADLLQEIGDVTEPPNQTTTGSPPDACMLLYLALMYILKVHLHGSKLHTLECQYLEKYGPKIQVYVISCNSNITLFVFISSTKYY